MNALPGTTGRRRIYLMRHGHVDYFGKEIQEADGDSRVVPLTEYGHNEAMAAGQALSHVRFDRALCSGLPRTRQTAEVVLAQQDGDAPALENEPALQEIMGGSFKSIRSRREISDLLSFAFESAHEPGASIGEGGETFTEAAKRSISVIENMLEKPGWHTALIVAHEGINRLLLGWAAGNTFTACQAFEQDTACINVIDFDLVPVEKGVGSKVERKLIKAVNLTPYNYVKHGMNLTSLEAIFEER